MAAAGFQRQPQDNNTCNRMHGGWFRISSLEKSELGMHQNLSSIISIEKSKTKKVNQSVFGMWAIPWHYIWESIDLLETYSTTNRDFLAGASFGNDE